MRLFIILSLLIHTASLAFFMWHKKQDNKVVNPPMSTMVQIVSSPEDYYEPPQETLNKPNPPQKKKKSLKKTPPKKILKQSLSRKGPSIAELEYAQKLQKFIEENRFYPKRAQRLKQQGTVVVSLKVLNNGDFEEVNLVEESKHKSLNIAAVSFLQDLKRFKPLPDKNKKKQEYIIPIFYKLSR